MDFAIALNVRNSAFAEGVAERDGLPEIRIENCNGLICGD
jgi:hypothetical protein